MKMLHLILAAVLTAGIVALPPPAEASTATHAAEIMPLIPDVSGLCQVGVANTQLLTTTATSLAFGGTWTTIFNPSTTTDALCDFCTGFNSTYAFKIGATATTHYPNGIANVAVTSDQICCKVASGTLTIGVKVGKNCP